MKISEMTFEELTEKVAAQTGMPLHYVEAWFNAADEHGLDNVGACRALGIARSMVGDDLDSWIYGDDFQMYLDMGCD